MDIPCIFGLFTGSDKSVFSFLPLWLCSGALHSPSRANLFASTAYLPWTALQLPQEHGASNIPPPCRTTPPARTAAAVREAAVDSASLNSLDTSDERLSPPEIAVNGTEEAVPCYAPEDFTMPPGEPSSIDRTHPAESADVFRCVGCTEPDCQVRCLNRRS